VKFSMDIVTKPYRLVQITLSHGPSTRGDYSKPITGQPHMTALRILWCGFARLLFGKDPEISNTRYQNRSNAGNKFLIAKACRSGGYVFRCGYIFTHDATSQWSQQAYLKAPNTEGWDRFGTSVSSSGNTLAVGAYLGGDNSTNNGRDHLHDRISDRGGTHFATTPSN